MDSQPQNLFQGGEKTPSLSWKNLPTGTVFSLQILDHPVLVQSSDFETGELAFWDQAKTQPKMAVVLRGTVTAGPHSVGEVRSIWAQKPSNMFSAIAAAQAAAGALVGPGGLLHIRFAGEVPHQNPRFSPIKQYEARYAPGAPAGDAFSATPATVPPPVSAPPATATPPGMQSWPPSAPVPSSTPRW